MLKGVRIAGGEALQGNRQHLRRDSEGARPQRRQHTDWVRETDAEQASPENNPFKVAEENRRLRRENERLTRGNDIHFKARAIFVNRQL